MLAVAELEERPIEARELSGDGPGDAPRLAVVGPAGTVDPAALFGDRKAAILERLGETGALLFRGFDLADAAAAEQLVLALGIQMDTDYLGGASPRSGLTRHLFSSTEAPARYIISFHTEMCYLRHRPAKIVFYCDREPEQAGETPLFDCARMLTLLPDALRERIEREGIIYRRYFRSTPSRINVFKTWQEAFGTTDREVAEDGCRRQGLEFEWNDAGDLVAQSRMPGIVTHPASGKRCLSLTLYNEYASVQDLARFSHRYNPLVRAAIGGFSGFMFGRPTIFMKTLWGNGEAISREDTQALIDTAWRASTIFRWRRGDLLILDNILTGHGRLNVTGPRLIAAGLGDPYDVESLATAAA
ncbi:MAG: TauD/TfdA family dioxygenase [Pseudomonadota bacterium]